jgi:putative transposase
MRHLTDKQRQDVLKVRRLKVHPYHHPPHRYSEETKTYLYTAACFEHQNHVGFTNERMTHFEAALLHKCEQISATVQAWCILPNHYHILLTHNNARAFSKLLGELHGGTSFDWNGEERARGRQVWCNYEEREIRSDRHFWATMNYIHNNPVRHGYTKKWQDWPWSSAASYLEQVGREMAIKHWREYPIDRYGEKWDL